jgi:hypothetical protein
MHHLHNHLHLCIIVESQEESVATELEATEEVLQKEPTQEMQAEEDAVDKLQECPDHRLSSFERGKPRNIISFLLYKSNYLHKCYIYIIALSYRS